MVVTFDDGYLDNFNCAAPVLKEYGVPSTFFITAGLIGTNHVTPWDEHLRGHVPWMTWPQVRELQAQGFDIGSHTMTHIDLGVVDPKVARQELQESKQVLEDRLGTRIPLFAYPFGGRQHLNDYNARLIKEVGYKCCCSAFGGFVTLDSDPFNIRRIGVNNWYESPAYLDFELRQIQNLAMPTY